MGKGQGGKGLGHYSDSKDQSPVSLPIPSQAAKESFMRGRDRDGVCMGVRVLAFQLARSGDTPRTHTALYLVFLWDSVGLRGIPPPP